MTPCVLRAGCLGGSAIRQMGVDDHPESWATVGVDLLNAIQEDARHRGAAQLVVVCGHLDEAKRAALDSCRLTIASEWWVAPLIEP